MIPKLPIPIVMIFLLPALIGAEEESDQQQRLGEDALAAGLWEVAALHFEQSLGRAAPDPAMKARVAIRLAEAWIRDGRAPAALELLEKSFLANEPETSFWKGQAWVAMGRFTDAVALLSEVVKNPDSPFRFEAALTVKNLQLSLDQPAAAIATLAALVDSGDAELAARARLHQVEILFDSGQAAAARALMPPGEEVAQADRSLETFLEAHLALAENRPLDAVTGFRALMDQARGLSTHRRQIAAIGLADALRASGAPDGALEFLLGFIQEHPESPQLEFMFQRLLSWMPETPGANDPILDRLGEWITAAEIPSAGLICNAGSDAVSVMPQGSRSGSSELLPFALFTRAVGLHRIPTPEARAEARFLLNRLRVSHPGHFLVSRALFESARFALNEGHYNQAFFLLDLIRENSRSLELRGKASFLEALFTYADDDAAGAARLFDEAAELLRGVEEETARLNAALSRLAADPSTPLTVLQTDIPENSGLAADLEIERALATEKPADRRSALEDFLKGHPQHPRTAEARLAAAEAALAGPGPDLSFARAQLDTLRMMTEADVDSTADLEPLRMAMLELRIDDFSGDAEAAIAGARAIMDQYSGQPSADEAALILGRILYEGRNYNDARLVLEKLAASDADPARAEAARLLAARSAALVPTSQSRQEALALFEKLIDDGGALASIARLEKSRLMIDMNRLAEAAGFLRQWFEKLSPGDPLHLPAGLLLGEAIYAQGGTETLAEALGVYDKLLEHAAQDPGVRNRLQYLRGRTLEQIPDPEDPARKREREAFVAYYSVLETREPPVEWHYFELCGFRALALLEKAGRWPAAIACARKIASFNGPRAEEATTRANQLQLQHMIWED